MKLNRSRWLAVALVAIVALDWITKFLVQNHVRLYARRVVVDGWVWLAHSPNPGIAFSFFRDMPGALRFPLLVAAAAIGIGVAARIALRTEDEWIRLAAVMVIAGAVGNLGDRVMNGWVTDFILIRWFPFVFNVADVAITAGAILLATRMLLAPPAHPAAPAEN
ncbi:MAG TPA: signal peptidase II [Longimicrobiaceae bacterium]|nr:signal peptidase II [Longimicrobiaceae bacterium]